VSGYALGRGDGWVYRHGVDFAVKAGELGTGNGAAVMEYLTAKGEEPPDHTHPTEDEMFYLVEGEVTFRCGDRSFDVGPGGFVFLPRGVEHGYSIASGGPVRFLVVTAPRRDDVKGWGGFIGGFEATAEQVKAPPDDGA